ncbi:uncharacterized protein LOC116752918 [Phocoena sinus]|uniref:uncharacterized protein LOC116752918 n=1 Tax=Phocoena sinus TaxID=42100 RepID=UPI0013C506FE|nr:uncharacterized protein LOC116752918 [Phocoena sinus]
MLSTFFPVACSLGSFLTTKLLCSPLNSINLIKARCVINPQPSRGDKTPIKENKLREKTKNTKTMETDNRLASLSESAPLRRSCQRGRVGALNGSAAGPSDLRPPRGRIPSTPGKQSLGRGRAGPGVARPIRPRSPEPRGGRFISMARGAPPYGRSPVPGCSGLSKLPESSPGRQASSSPPPRSLDRGRPWRGGSLQPQSRRPHNPPCVQSRRAAVRNGAGPGASVGACACVRVCAWMQMRGERRVAAAAVDSPPRLRTVARGGSGGARANSRSPRPRAAPWLIPERPVIGQRPPLCKRAEGMEFLGPGLQ